MAFEQTFTLANMQDTSNPYYLHPNETPSLQLVTTLLDEKNFHPWQRSMKMSLLTKNKLGFVNGSIKEPLVSDPIHPFWERCNTIVLAWLNRAISPAIAQSLLWIENAEELWKELEERYSQQDMFRIADLQEDVFSFKQGNLSVSMYFTGLKALLDELDVLLPIPSCTCNSNCTCGALKKVREQRNLLHVIRFLKGLNEQYSGVRSNIMLMNPLPTLNKAFGLVAQQERQFACEHHESMAATHSTYPRIDPNNLVS